MRKMIAALALIALACGGGDSGATQGEADAPAPPAAAPGTTPPAAGTGTVHEVEMKLTDAGSYVYEPDELTIKVGDTVRWLNINGFPHNVAFYEDQIPQGSAEVLASLIPAEGKLAPLSSKLLLQPNQQVEITFTGVPAGDYGYYCTPHEALGMVASLTIQQ